MSDTKPISRPGTGWQAASHEPARETLTRGRSVAPPAQVFFDRQELDAILNVYARMVAAGEWRDYAIDSHKDSVTFSVFRRASEMPLFRIEKRPKLARKQGAYAVIIASGMTIRRGKDITQVLKVFDRHLLRAVT